MYGKTLSALLVLIIIALGVVFFVFQVSSPDGKSYKNSVHRYELTFPSRFDVKEYTDDISTFGIVTEDAVEGYAEARVITAQGEPGQTWQDAVAVQLMNLCAADGPTASFSCTDTISLEPFTTADAEQGYALILKGEYRLIASTTSETIPKGPYYMIPLITSATISKVLVIAPPLNLSTAEADGTLVRSIAESVRVDR